MKIGKVGVRKRAASVTMHQEEDTLQQHITRVTHYLQEDSTPKSLILEFKCHIGSS